MFWRNFKFKYKLTITNENTLEEVVGIHVSKLNGVSVLLLTFTVIFFNRINNYRFHSFEKLFTGLHE